MLEVELIIPSTTIQGVYIHIYCVRLFVLGSILMSYMRYIAEEILIR